MPSNHLILCVPFSSCPQSLPASGSFPVSRLFTSDGQSIGASASSSVLPMSLQGCFPLGLTGLISLLSKGLPSWWVFWFSWNLLCGYLKITKLTSYILGLFQIQSHPRVVSKPEIICKKSCPSCGLPFPFLENLPDPGIKPEFPVSPALQADSLLSEQPEKPSFPIISG